MLKLDGYKDALIRNELEKAKLQLKIEFSASMDDLETKFQKELQTKKKLCDKAVVKLKNSFQDENNSLKQLIKVF